MEMAAIRIGQRYDIFMGGLTGVNNSHRWPCWKLCGAPICAPACRIHAAGLVTMNNMLLGGLYDHVGGGFFRYTNDERWMVPHFERRSRTTLCWSIS